ncbi:phage repressor protein [Rhodoplanes roseus]|uniref:HTH cro/C1-type domain-containing protein n=1 Tax=Rhodoplanes roseus TaxID=29409 RepID=A0A327KS63_9BRAD|nr:phage repressor protein [Rhodoplanes roseus]RAI40132.1 hypothetical protein CH341_24420 [Rhodoplanes roseus]
MKLRSAETTPEVVYERIARRLAEIGKAELAAAVEAGLGRDAIRDIRRKPKNLPSIRTIERLAPVLRTTPSWLAFGEGEEEPRAKREGQRVVRVVGYVGAGDAAHYYAVAQGDLDEIPVPDGLPRGTVAVEIRGDSLGRLFNRWLAFYEDVRRPVTEDQIGRLCVVGLPDDRVLIKQLRSARSGQGYDLISQADESTITDVEPSWAAVVIRLEPH